ncbi:MAG TPA: alpha/beta hydrolase [Pseudolabrys sp.]|jgi:pimeloyl-ACP methyl ester carboxylesterase|nr:alpha/beta hydrolase [Pseudolabrys sp.]
MFDEAPIRRVRTQTLEIAFREFGHKPSPAVCLLHGWPYDPYDFEKVAPRLAAAGYRVLVPFLRGFGPTRFLSEDTFRSGQQAALGRDLIEFLDAVDVPVATLAGFDWGGRAACIVAALHPQRVSGLVTVNGYSIFDVSGSIEPATPEQEMRFWYQYYFHTERGRLGLRKNKREIAKLLWQLWSPNWTFGDAEFARSAVSFDNPDFVDVTVHSYRARYGNAEGDPELTGMESLLQARPPIVVPTISIRGEADGVVPPAMSSGHERFFTGWFRRLDLPGVGHNPPREAPNAFLEAILDVATVQNRG